MNRYKVTMKSGVSAVAECKYVDILTVHSMLNEHNPFIKIGDLVFAKDFVATIEKLKETEKEN